MKWSAVVSVAVLAMWPSAVRAQPVPGTEFRLNSFLPGGQQIPRMAADAAGNFVVVWQSQDQDGSNGAIVGRRFSAAGRPLTAEFIVNAYTTDLQDAADVASAGDGSFVVVWNSLFQDGSGRGVFGRRFSPAGVPVGAEFAVNTYTTGSQGTPNVALDASGTALVSWLDVGGTHGRRFDPAGQPVGSELTLATWTATDIEASPGGFILVGENTSRQVMARRLDASGAPVGSEFQVAPSPNLQFWAQAGVDGAGRFLVTWSERVMPTTAGDLMGRRFDATGVPLAPAAPVSTEPEIGYRAGISFHPDGRFMVVWTDNAGLFDWDIAGRRYDATGTPEGAPFRVNFVTGYLQSAPVVGFSPAGNIMAAWSNDLMLDVSGRLFGVVPAALSVDPTGNGVLEPGEAARVETSWANLDMRDWTLSGTAASFSGPGGTAPYSIPDAAADYGFVPDGTISSCAAGGDCYQVGLAAGPRPLTHWDATLREELSSGGFANWTLHVGESFADVPRASAYYRFVETLLHGGVTAGCAAGTYCPLASTAREQMAVFALVAKEGAGYRPRACATPLFADVPAASPYCPFVEELARRGVVSGCGGGSYCPSLPVTRQEMAVFVVRTADPDFTPPACAAPMFADVPAGSPFCRWIEELARRGVVTGCGNGNFCPGQPVTREQMAVFIGAGFGLTLYGP